MNQSIHLKLIISIVLSLVLTACGSSGVDEFSAHGESDIQRSALEKMTQYAEGQGPALVVQDFIDAEIIGVNITNLAELNKLIATSNKKDVDTLDEIQALVSSLAPSSPIDDESTVKINETPVVEIKADTNPPVISLLGSNPITLIQGNKYTDPGATAIDDKDGVVQVTTVGEVNNTKVGKYIIIYNSIDKYKNKSSESRVIEVVAAPDNNAPSVSQVLISGTAKAGGTLTLNYTFKDADKDIEGNSIIAWTTANKELQRGNKKTLLIPQGLEGTKITAWVHPLDSKGKEGKAVESNALQVQAIVTEVATLSDESVIQQPAVTAEPETQQPTATEEPITPDEPVTAPVSTSGFGASQIPASALSRGTVFVDQNGAGDDCSEESPCGISTALKKAKAGDVVFFRGGVYSLTLDNNKALLLSGGSAGAPITYESYPGEKAIFNGSSLPRGYAIQTGIYLNDDYITIRNIDVSGMPAAGIRVNGNYNIIEGVEIYNNNGSGLHITNGTDGPSPSSTGGSNNIIRHNVIHGNSDAGLTGQGGYNDGNNADGIAVSHGVNNLISHNTVYSNSDDGIDTWISNYTIVEYNLVYNQGRGDGDGNGIKLGGVRNNGGAYPSALASTVGIGAIARNNIVFNNKSEGVSCNHGKRVRIQNNTSYNNGTIGFWTCSNDNVATNNISSANPDGDYLEGSGSNNSWDVGGEAEFISTDRKSANFLKPVAGSNFDGIGAHFK